MRRDANRRHGDRGYSTSSSASKTDVYSTPIGIVVYLLTKGDLY